MSIVLFASSFTFEGRHVGAPALVINIIIVININVSC